MHLLFRTQHTLNLNNPCDQHTILFYKSYLLDLHKTFQLITWLGLLLLCMTFTCAQIQIFLGFNKGRSSKFREVSWVRQTPEQAQRTYRPKRCGNNNEDEDNCPKTLNDKNHQASSQKFRRLIFLNLDSGEAILLLSPVFVQSFV